MERGRVFFLSSLVRGRVFWLRLASTGNFRALTVVYLHSSVVEVLRCSVVRYGMHVQKSPPRPLVAHLSLFLPFHVVVCLP